jgi:hypothetical protein
MEYPSHVATAFIKNNAMSLISRAADVDVVARMGL